MKIEPKLLTTEELVQMYRVYDLCGQIFEGSNMARLFAHIAALVEVIQHRDALIEILHTQQK